MTILSKLKTMNWRKIFLVSFIFLILVAVVLYCIVLFFPDESDYSDCNVVGINLHGDLYTYIPEDKDGKPLEGYEDTVSSENILLSINQAEYDENIKAILVEVDSAGGSPVAAEEIMLALKQANKPVVAFIREKGLSAAYYAISSADHIFASKNSDVGSIGVTMSYLDNVDKNKKDGYRYVQLSSGRFKDSGSPDKPLTDEEKAIFMRDIKIIHNNFVSDVAVNRKISVADVQKMADGSSVLGERAKTLKLIDGIGNFSNAENYLWKKIGEVPEICWY